MAQRLFRFKPTNGSGRYRAQVISCQTGAVLSSSGYNFDRILTGQPNKEGFVELLFDEVPAGTVIPSGYQLKVTDMGHPEASVLGICGSAPATICGADSPCAISNITHSVSASCTQDGQFTVSFGFSVDGAGEYIVELRRNQTGQLIGQKSLTTIGPGNKTGTMPMAVRGIIPGTPIQMRVRSATDGNCQTIDTTNLITVDDTWATQGPRYIKQGDCAAIQQGACSSTFRVVAVDCTTGTVLPNQPADWPLKSTSKPDLESHLGARGYAEVSNPTQTPTQTQNPTQTPTQTQNPTETPTQTQNPTPTPTNRDFYVLTPPIDIDLATVVFTPVGGPIDIDLATKQVIVFDEFAKQTPTSNPTPTPTNTPTQTACQRPANLKTISFFWNYSLTGGEAKLFGSLGEACQYGKLIIGDSTSGTLATARVQAASFSLNERVYDGTGTDCYVLAAGYYFVLSDGKYYSVKINGDSRIESINECTPNPTPTPTQNPTPTPTATATPTPTACQRPAGLKTFSINWNYALTGGNATLFNSLGEACQYGGQIRADSSAGTLASSSVQAASLTVGQMVYDGVGNNCYPLGRGYYYVLSDGKYYAVKVNGDAKIEEIMECQPNPTPTPTQNPTPTPTQTACQRPGGLNTYTTYWNYAVTGGDAKVFGSLGEACQYGTMITSDPSSGQLAATRMQGSDLSVNQQMFEGTGTDCNKISAGYYFVASSGKYYSVKINGDSRIESINECTPNPTPTQNPTPTPTACQRPGGLSTFTFNWNYAVTGGEAKLFSSLAEACQYGTQITNDPSKGSLATAGAQLVSLSAGQKAWAGTGSDCSVVSAGIYFVSQGGRNYSVKINGDGLIETINECVPNPTPTPTPTSTVPLEIPAGDVGSAALNIVMVEYPSVGYSEVQLVVTTPGISITGATLQSVADENKCFLGGKYLSMALANATYGYAPPVGGDIGNHSFAFNIVRLRAAFPGLNAVSFDVFVKPPNQPNYAYAVNRVNYSYHKSNGVISTCKDGNNNVVDGVPCRPYYYDYKDYSKSVGGFKAYGSNSSAFALTGGTRKKIGTMNINLSTGVSEFVANN